MSDELKPLPCPFCGSERVTVEAGDGFRWRVAGCCDCGALASEVRCNTFMDDRAAAEAEAKQRAIEEWNRRAPDTQLAAMTAERDAALAKVAALREALVESVDQMIGDAMSIEWEYGDCRMLEKMEADHDLSPAIYLARNALEQTQ